MPDGHQNERPKGRQWAQQEKRGMENQRRQAASSTKQGGGQQGNERAPGKPVGKWPIRRTKKPVAT